MAATLSVWEDVESLEHFVWNTLHKRFYDRRDEWYDSADALRFAMWWVPTGHCPDMVEAVARFRHLAAHGESETAFGWDYVKEIR